MKHNIHYSLLIYERFIIIQNYRYITIWINKLNKAFIMINILLQIIKNNLIDDSV